MIFLRIACVSFTSLFFTGAVAQETKYVYLKTCTETASHNDPSILSRKTVESESACGTGHAVKVTIVDTWYGIEMPAKTVLNVAAPSRVVRPQSRDIFQTHKPCRVAYPDVGFVVEWLVPIREVCNGRPAGSYYRVYTPHNEICIRPSVGECVHVSKLHEDGQRRFAQTLRIAYEEYVKR